MAVISLTHASITTMHGVLLEEGCKDERWPLAADARIKTEENSLGVGPVVYKGRTKDADGNFSSDGTVQDGIFMFFDDDGTTIYALTSGQSETDIDDTIADYLNTHGGDIAVMKSNKPTVT